MMFCPSWALSEGGQAAESAHSPPTAAALSSHRRHSPDTRPSDLNSPTGRESCIQLPSPKQQAAFDRSPCAVVGYPSALQRCDSRSSSGSGGSRGSFTGTLDWGPPIANASTDAFCCSARSTESDEPGVPRAELGSRLGWVWDLSCFLGDYCLFGGCPPADPVPALEGSSGRKRTQLKRQRSTGAAEAVRGLDMRGQVALITDGSGALGREVVRALCQAGVHVVIASQELEQARAVAAEVVADNPRATLSVMYCDLASFPSIRAFVQEFLAMQLPLHLLINAASHSPRPSMSFPSSSCIRGFSDDGYEMTFAVGYLGHFLLTELLIPKIRQTAFEEGDQGRIVNVCPVNLSTGRPCAAASLGCEDAAEIYANARQASLSLALYAVELAHRLSAEDTSRRHCPLVTINACSPAAREADSQESGVSACVPVLCKSPSARKQVMSVDAALPLVHLACSRLLRDTSGRYFVGIEPTSLAYSSHSLRESCNDLYESSLHMVGLALEGSPRHAIPLSP